MSKTIVFHPNDWTNLNAPFLESIWKKFLQIEMYDDTKNYSPTKYVFWTGCLNRDKWYKTHHDNGGLVIIDHLWESNLEEVSTNTDNILTLRARNFIWYNESLWYKSFGYNNYQPNKTYKNSYLMLLNLVKFHRDAIIGKINLTDALYSYIGRGIYIDGDVEHIGSWQRFFNPNWYDNTSFSVVVETTTNAPTFISEKTFKPFAYYHPFILWGSPNTLQYVHELGFETFSHLFDEDYDTISDSIQRLNTICNLTKEILPNHKTMFLDKCTQDVLKHNHNLFFHDSIEQRFINDIVSQVLEFIE
jgi:hypothetical protein